MLRKEKLHGYHWAELSSPLVSWKIAAATSTPIEARSSAVTASRRRLPSAGGRSKSRG